MAHKFGLLIVLCFFYGCMQLPMETPMEDEEPLSVSNSDSNLEQPLNKDFSKDTEGLYNLHFQKNPNKLTMFWETDSTLVSSVSIYYSNNQGERWRLIKGGISSSLEEWENFHWSYPPELKNQQVLVQLRNYFMSNYCVRAVVLE